MTCWGPQQPIHRAGRPRHVAASHRGPGVLASFQARPLPVIPEPPSCNCLYASRARELTASLPTAGLAQKPWMPWVGGQTGRGCLGNCRGPSVREMGKMGRGRSAHLCPPPSPAGQPGGRPPP